MKTRPTKTRNPNFKDESLNRMSWTRVAKGQFPHLRDTICCSRKARQGDVVVTFPVIQGNELKATIVVHELCLSRYLTSEVPEDFTSVQKKVRGIKDRFQKVS